jgi:lipopolysaccharide/colanic/teichoic acid biosynthesis glycosyltransferase
MLDIAGSLAGLVLTFPLFLVIAAAVKADSKGPVLFRQERIGRLGNRFVFLKIRSMYTGSDTEAHRTFIRKFIRGTLDSPGEAAPRIFKLTEDNRITRVGRFLRKTSLDEFPQLINVLKGDMSLVGPRPPIPYECSDYDVWHRARIMEMKPGITGLWQVKGRSSTDFDSMVRLDIRYIREWSLLLDIRILLATPRAVLSGKGAY